jgi:hypothetical protein
MQKAELIKIIELYKKDMISCETLRSAVDTYSSVSNGAKPIVSGSVCDNCGEDKAMYCAKCYKAADESYPG